MSAYDFGVSDGWDMSRVLCQLEGAAQLLTDAEQGILNSDCVALKKIYARRATRLSAEVQLLIDRIEGHLP